MRRIAATATGVVPVVLVCLALAGCGLTLLKKSDVSVSPGGGDDYQLLKNAIDKVKDGGTVHLATGRYNLGQPLVIVKSVRLVGDGLDKTIISGTGADSVVEFNTLHKRPSCSAQGIAFVHGGGQTADAVDVVAAEVTFDKCAFSGGAGGQGGGNGIAYFNDSGGAVTSCLSTGNAASGIHVQDAASPTLTGNDCRKNGEAGIALVGHASVTASNNTCTLNKWDGIHVQDSAAPLLQANTCTQNKGSGILFMADAAGKALKNTCTRNAESGISILDQSRPLLDGTIVSGNVYGLAYYNNAGGTATHTKCPGDGVEIGIALFDNARPKLVDNQCKTMSMR